MANIEIFVEDLVPLATYRTFAYHEFGIIVLISSASRFDRDAHVPVVVVLLVCLARAAYRNAVLNLSVIVLIARTKLLGRQTAVYLAVVCLALPTSARS